MGTIGSYEDVLRCNKFAVALLKNTLSILVELKAILYLRDAMNIVLKINENSHKTRWRSAADLSASFYSKLF